MKIIKTWGNASDRQLDEICAALKSGEVIIVPTDTLYAVVGHALDSKAVDKVCAIKGIKPDKNTLSILCSDIAMAAEYSRFDNNSFRLLKDNTPGPFTFIFKSAPTLPKAFKQRKTVGIRIPDNSVCRQIIERLGAPLMGTSIKIEADDWLINPELIAERYDHLSPILVEDGDGGTEPGTIVDCTGSTPEIIREGKGEL